MTDESKTLEEFVENYIQNRAKASSKESYADWIISHGGSPEKIYADSMREIAADYAVARSQHGANAEGLARLGLSASGYSDYINGKAYSEMQKSKSDARALYAKAASDNAASYKEYLSEYAKKESQGYEKVVEELTERGVIDYDTAYNYAVGAGLGEDIAKAAAKTASDLGRAKLKKSIVNTVMSQQLTSSQAKEYALQLGLSETEADEIARYAANANEYVSSGGYTDKDYLEELKKKAELKD